MPKVTHFVLGVLRPAEWCTENSKPGLESNEGQPRSMCCHRQLQKLIAGLLQEPGGLASTSRVLHVWQLHYVLL